MVAWLCNTWEVLRFCLGLLIIAGTFGIVAVIIAFVSIAVHNLLQDKGDPKG